MIWAILSNVSRELKGQGSYVTTANRRQDRLPRSCVAFDALGFAIIWLFLEIVSPFCGCPYGNSSSIWGLCWGS